MVAKVDTAVAGHVVTGVRQVSRGRAVTVELVALAEATVAPLLLRLGLGATGVAACPRAEVAATAGQELFRILVPFGSVTPVPLATMVAVGLPEGAEVVVVEPEPRVRLAEVLGVVEVDRVQALPRAADPVGVRSGSMCTHPSST